MPSWTVPGRGDPAGGGPPVVFRCRPVSSSACRFAMSACRRRPRQAGELDEQVHRPENDPTADHRPYDAVAPRVCSMRGAERANRVEACHRSSRDLLVGVVAGESGGPDNTRAHKRELLRVCPAVHRSYRHLSDTPSAPDQAPVRRSEPTCTPSASSCCRLPQNEARRNSYVRQLARSSACGPLVRPARPCCPTRRACGTWCPSCWRGPGSGGRSPRSRRRCATTTGPTRRPAIHRRPPGNGGPTCPSFGGQHAPRL
jgi:hypothetical protein